jgi:hypothetical protein
MPDARRSSASTARNRQPILEVVRRVLPERGLVLEIASGAGEHAVFFASYLPELTFQPSDRDPGAVASVAAWAGDFALANVLPPLLFDVRDPWPVSHADAVVAINMIHIAPWEACEALFAGASQILPAGAPVVTYGPYKVGGAHTAPSNEAFDATLRARDPSWGVRDVESVEAAAAAHGFLPIERVSMPANNLSLIFRRGAGTR